VGTLGFAGRVRAGFTPHTRAEVWRRIARFPRRSCLFLNLPCVRAGRHSGLGSAPGERLDRIEPGTIYIMDRGYLDIERLHRFTDEDAFFVTRTKKGIRFRRRASHPVDFVTGLVSDHTVGVATVKARCDYPDQLRRVRYIDPTTMKRLTFLTNNFTLPALTIPQLYKSRWALELFFRWIKQHLRIKAFYGTSENAVKTQIWIALSVYVLVAIVKKRLALDVSLYKLLQILSVTLFEKMPISIAVFDVASQLDEIDDGNQLQLFDL
jgi:hypothetical protein